MYYGLLIATRALDRPSLFLYNIYICEKGARYGILREICQKAA
jgi:hypothetical protein